jgi:hypothetical protein
LPNPICPRQSETYVPTPDSGGGGGTEIHERRRSHAVQRPIQTLSPANCRGGIRASRPTSRVCDSADNAHSWGVSERDGDHGPAGRARDMRHGHRTWGMGHLRWRPVQGMRRHNECVNVPARGEGRSSGREASLSGSLPNPTGEESPGWLRLVTRMLAIMGGSMVQGRPTRVLVHWPPPLHHPLAIAMASR